MTETGRSVAEKIPEVDLALYFPFDYPFSVRRLLNLVNPAMVVIMETEIWPNFLAEAKRRGIPTIMANGRISDRSFGRYLKARSLFRPVLDKVTRFCMQSDEDARRIIAIGAAPDRVHSCRNLKLDIPSQRVTDHLRSELRQKFGIPSSLRVFTAGSTHQGEEEEVIAAYRQVLESDPGSFLVLVPRHPERADAVGELLRSSGIGFARRSVPLAADSHFIAGQVLLVDTVGELMQFYALSDLVFVGGSLVPFGGHNLLEPASLGVPLLFGPHMHNFREIAALVGSYGAGQQVADAGELAGSWLALLNDPERLRVLGDNGIRLLEENGGAVERHMEIIGMFLMGES
jgi:3-deoxy-D-manno-octulosonic-acid transferase